MNQYISDSRTEAGICTFPIHVYKYGMRNKCLSEPFLEINILMKLKSSNQLETYQK